MKNLVVREVRLTMLQETDHVKEASYEVSCIGVKIVNRRHTYDKEINPVYEQRAMIRVMYMRLIHVITIQTIR